MFGPFAGEHCPPFGMHAWTLPPTFVATTAHVSSESHSSPFGQEVAQNVTSPPIFTQLAFFGHALDVEQGSQRSL